MTNLFQLTFPKQPGGHLRWGQLHGSALALAISQATDEHPGLVVVVTPDLLTTSKLLREIKFFNPEKRLFTFPDWETLPYDHFFSASRYCLQAVRSFVSFTQLAAQYFVITDHHFDATHCTA